MRWEKAFATSHRRLAKKKEQGVDRRAEVLRDIEPRVHDDFMDWMNDLYDDDKPTMQDNLADESSRGIFGREAQYHRSARRTD